MLERAILARHAESESNAANVLNGDPKLRVPLTERGRDQARELRAVIDGEDIRAVITSEFPRAIETADLAVGHRNLPTVVVAELNDPRGGAWEGMDLDEYLAWAAASDPADAPPDGESLREVLARVATALRVILARTEQAVLVIGHGLPISTVLAAAEADLDERSVYPPVPNAEPFVLTRRQLEIAAGRIERAVDP
ncbi:MAG: histidine phosphatase family protein [Actinomycetota bacterium]